MDRRRFIARAAAAATTVAVGEFPAAAMAEASEKRRPNVLLLMSDQHKRTCMGAAGDRVAVTPNLDRLAAESVRFTDAYCTNPVCTPSRASLMTGMYSHNLEAQDNAHPFAAEHKTMAHHFGAAGYVTALMGKMHFVDAQTHGFDYKIDFNDWFQYLGPKVKLYADELGRPNSGAGMPEVDDFWREDDGKAFDPWKGVRTLDDREGSVAVGRVSKLAEDDHFDNFVAREAVRFLGERAAAAKSDEGAAPFFLVTSFLKPHDPFMPAERFAKMFDAEKMQLPHSWGKADLAKVPAEVRRSIEFNGPTPEVRDAAMAKRHIAFYYANLAQMDDCLGRVVRAVEELGLERDTIICYTADHGEMLGELGLWQKFQFYEGSCGVPLMVRVPGREAGICRTPVSLVSMSATLTELSGVRQITKNDGVSFADLVREPSSTRSHGPVYAEFSLGDSHAKAMVRDGELKYTYWTHDLAELYDLKADPEELRNLAGDVGYQADVARLKGKLFRWHEPVVHPVG